MAIFPGFSLLKNEQRVANWLGVEHQADKFWSALEGGYISWCGLGFNDFIRFGGIPCVVQILFLLSLPSNSYLLSFYILSLVHRSSTPTFQKYLRNRLAVWDRLRLKRDEKNEWSGRGPPIRCKLNHVTDKPKRNPVGERHPASRTWNPTVKMWVIFHIMQDVFHSTESLQWQTKPKIRKWVRW